MNRDQSAYDTPSPASFSAPRYSHARGDCSSQIVPPINGCPRQSDRGLATRLIATSCHQAAAAHLVSAPSPRRHSPRTPGAALVGRHRVHSHARRRPRSPSHCPPQSQIRHPSMDTRAERGGRQGRGMTSGGAIRACNEARRLPELGKLVPSAGEIPLVTLSIVTQKLQGDCTEGFTIYGAPSTCCAYLPWPSAPDV